MLAAIASAFAGRVSARFARRAAIAVSRSTLPADVVMVDVRLEDSVPVAEAAAELSAGFESAAGWNPAEEGPGWRFFRLRPVQIQAYRGYGERRGRAVMRDARWLA